KTISLDKARARKERPPALKEIGEGDSGIAELEGEGVGGVEEDVGVVGEKGLGITQEEEKEKTKKEVVGEEREKEDGAVAGAEMEDRLDFITTPMIEKVLAMAT
ncbi:hypothetical protein LTR28_001207, partial [Elasticomyces elasticus]